MHLFEMYKRLNPNQKHEVQREATRQVKIEELESELQKAKKKVSVWKSTICVFAIVVSLFLALK